MRSSSRPQSAPMAGSSAFRRRRPRSIPVSGGKDRRGRGDMQRTRARSGSVSLSAARPSPGLGAGVSAPVLPQSSVVRNATREANAVFTAISTDIVPHLQAEPQDEGPDPKTPHRTTKARGRRLHEMLELARKAEVRQQMAFFGMEIPDMVQQATVLDKATLEARQRLFAATLTEIDSKVNAAGFVRNSNSESRRPWVRATWFKDDDSTGAGASRRPHTAGNPSGMESPTAGTQRRGSLSKRRMSLVAGATVATQPVRRDPRAESYKPADRLAAKLDAARHQLKSGKPDAGAVILAEREEEAIRRRRRSKAKLRAATTGAGPGSRSHSALGALDQLSDILERNVLAIPLRSKLAVDAQRAEKREVHAQRLAAAKAKHIARLTAKVERARFLQSEARQERQRLHKIRVARTQAWQVVVAHLTWYRNQREWLDFTKTARVTAVREHRSAVIIQRFLWTCHLRRNRAIINRVLRHYSMQFRMVRRVRAVRTVLLFLRTLAPLGRMRRTVNKFTAIIRKTQRMWRGTLRVIRAHREVALRQWENDERLRRLNAALETRAQERGERYQHQTAFSKEEEAALRPYTLYTLVVPENVRVATLNPYLRQKRWNWYHALREWKSHMKAVVLPTVAKMQRGAVIAQRMMHSGNAGSFRFEPEALDKLEVEYPPRPTLSAMLTPRELRMLINDTVARLELETMGLASGLQSGLMRDLGK